MERQTVALKNDVSFNSTQMPSFTCIILEHPEGCKTPHLSAPCNCADAPRIWTCSTCKYQFKQVSEPTQCHVCPYLMRHKNSMDKDAVKVTCEWTTDVHDGYCSDHDGLEEVVQEQHQLLPADVDKKQLAYLSFSVDAPGHCCCGASESWGKIRIQMPDASAAP